MIILPKKLICIVLLLNFAFLNQGFAQTPQEIHDQNKEKTYNLYFGRTLELFEKEPIQTTFALLFTTSASYAGLSIKSYLHRFSATTKIFYLTDFALINDHKRLSQYIELYLKGDAISLEQLRESISRQYLKVYELIVSLDTYIKSSYLNDKLPFHERDVGLSRSTARLARIVQALQYVPPVKHGEFFDGLKKFGYRHWIESPSVEAIKYMTKHRLIINPTLEHSRIPNQYVEINRGIKDKGKVARRTLRGANALLAGYALVEIVLLLNEDQKQQTYLFETPEELDEIARTDWPMFEMILDEHPELAQAGAKIFDQIPTTQKSLNDLDVLLGL